MDCEILIVFFNLFLDRNSVCNFCCSSQGWCCLLYSCSFTTTC